MEVTELTLWAARLGVLALMYLLVLVLIFALRADARAAVAPRMAPPSPAPKPVPTPASTPVSAPVAETRSLHVLHGTAPSVGNDIPLVGPVEIGRSTSCAVSIPNTFVSSRHVRVYPQGGGWMVEDLGSTNGTVLNGQPLHAPHRLKPGDRLLVGDTEFEVK